MQSAVDRVATASGHIDTLAKAVKRAGDKRPIDHIRADLFLGMIDGTYTGLNDTEIINQLLAAAQSGESDDMDGHHQGDDRSAGDSNDDDAHGGGWPEIDSDPRDGSDTGRNHLHFGAPDGEPAGCDEDGGGAGAAAATDPPGRPVPAAAAGSGMEVRVRLSTLLGHDQHPAELAGWGPVHAELARDLAATLGGGQWRFAGENCYASDAHRRTPGTALRRYLEIRDRYCIMIGCRAPARTADKDHTRDHDHGGPTTDDNLGDVCRHDHRLKHEGGWRLRQPQTGHFHWTSRLGHSYHRQPSPILEPLPDPIPRDRPPYPLMIHVDDGWDDTEIWEDPPPEPDPSNDIPPY